MYIKEVELRNFKSFGRSTRVPLRNDFITVTGPNGSGKSNIVDALLFALCLSSSRAMRAERLPDLIYRGDDGKNPDFAQVTVRLDNSGRVFPLDQDTVEVSRRIKLNHDKYASSYYFNGRPCSQADLQDKLAKAGITPESYNIVMQGDVTRIIEMTPVERRRIVDEIAGVAEFDEKKRRSLEELDVVRERIARVDVILEEVGAQLERLQAERDRALSYRALREELRRQQAFLLLARLKEVSLELSRLEEEVRGLQARDEEVIAGLEHMRSDLSALDERLSSLSSEITHKGEDEQIQVKRRIEELKGQIAREEDRREMAERASLELDEQQKSCFLQIDRASQEVEALSAKIRDAELRGAGLRGELEDWMRELSRVEEELSSSDVRYSRLRDELKEALELREEAKSRLSDLVRERDRLLDASRRGSLEREELSAGIREELDALAGADQEAEQLRSDLAALNSRAMELEREEDDLESARLRLRREIAEKEREMQQLSGEQARIEGHLKSSEGGYSRAVGAIRSAIKKQMLSGLYGTVAELGVVDPRYSAALEVAAGARMQSIVAATDEAAAEAIDYLKTSQIGRATFLPLNRLERGGLPARPKHQGVIDYALNLVSFDKKFMPAFWYVFRDTLVVETLSHARALMGRYRMVTLEGDLVERSGAMTGGHYRSRMKFAAEETRRLSEISERISSADRERGQLLEELDRTEGQISAISREVDELNREISRRTFRLDEISAARPRIERAIQERRQRLVQMEEDALGYKERLDLLEGEISRAEDELEELHQTINRLEGDLSGSDIPELNRRADAARSEIRRLKERLEEIDGEVLRERIREESLSERRAELDASRASLEQRRAEALQRKEEASARIQELQEQLASALAREGEIESELSGLKGERGELLGRTLELQREIDRAEREHERIQARLLASTAARDAAALRRGELEAEIEGCGVDSSEEPPDSSTVAEKIRATEEAMRQLEPVNMLAIDEYDHVKTRHEMLGQRRSTLALERQAIIEKLERYDQMKKEAFLSSFQEINRNFRDIFAELSDGAGELILENPEDPLSAGLTIRARPAGKPFHRLEAMSGGEKSLTALSFIFSIQMYRPAPFYAMDEIDMFLDGANVERVARLIKRISDRAQFIVVSLRKPMIQQSRYTIGVTMQEDNISSVTGISTAEVET
ncbi:MAG: chromosome segregation protein SMC [Methanothrix sp.]|nr:chromosome segregation protein SMC [Methanothrix sp.]